MGKLMDLAVMHNVSANDSFIELVKYLESHLAVLGDELVLRVGASQEKKNMYDTLVAESPVKLTPQKAGATSRLQGSSKAKYQAFADGDDVAMKEIRSQVEAMLLINSDRDQKSKMGDFVAKCALHLPVDDRNLKSAKEACQKAMHERRKQEDIQKRQQGKKAGAAKAEARAQGGNIDDEMFVDLLFGDEGELDDALMAFSSEPATAASAASAAERVAKPARSRALFFPVAADGGGASSDDGEPSACAAPNFTGSC
jgi:hypothetical protein